MDHQYLKISGDALPSAKQVYRARNAAIKDKINIIKAASLLKATTCTTDERGETQIQQRLLKLETQITNWKRIHPTETIEGPNQEDRKMQEAQLDKPR